MTDPFRAGEAGLFWVGVAEMGLGAGHGEIPSASAGMTDLSRGLTGPFRAGMTDLSRG